MNRSRSTGAEAKEENRVMSQILKKRILLLFENFFFFLYHIKSVKHKYKNWDIERYIVVFFYKKERKKRYIVVFDAVVWFV